MQNAYFLQPILLHPDSKLHSSSNYEIRYSAKVRLNHFPDKLFDMQSKVHFLLFLR